MLEIPWPEPPIIVAIIAALGVALGAWLTWLASGASRLQARVAALEERNDRQEQRIADLEKSKKAKDLVISLMASFIDRLGAYWAGGCHGRLPLPDPKIHSYIDTDPWTPTAEGVDG